MNSQDPSEAKLAALFSAYREACPDPDPDANFMPKLWQKIEAQQAYTRDLKWLARGLVTAAAALSLLIGVFLIRLEPAPSFYSSTYIEVLAADQESNSETAEIIPASHERF